jgi:hypothetical protein
VPDREISADGEEAFRRLHELFGAADPSAASKRGCRRYVLEFRDGQPLFQRANPSPVHPRDDIEWMLDQIIEEEFGDDIVPKKIGQNFPRFNCRNSPSPLGVQCRNSPSPLGVQSCQMDVCR